MCIRDSIYSSGLHELTIGYIYLLTSLVCHVAPIYLSMPLIILEENIGYFSVFMPTHTGNYLNILKRTRVGKYKSRKTLVPPDEKK